MEAFTGISGEPDREAKIGRTPTNKITGNVVDSSLECSSLENCTSSSALIAACLVLTAGLLIVGVAYLRKPK
jgi:hypothetical protein